MTLPISNENMMNRLLSNSCYNDSPDFDDVRIYTIELCCMTVTIHARITKQWSDDPGWAEYEILKFTEE